MTSMIGFYNGEVERFSAKYSGLDTKARQAQVDGFIDTDPTRISWTHNVKQDLVRNHIYAFESGNMVSSLYRPFTKQWLYYNRRFNERVYQMPRIFPDAGTENLVIGVSAAGEKVAFSALISRHVPSLHFVDIEGSQCFPLYLYDEAAQASDSDLLPSRLMAACAAAML